MKNARKDPIDSLADQLKYQKGKQRTRFNSPRLENHVKVLECLQGLIHQSQPTLDRILHSLKALRLIKNDCKDYKQELQIIIMELEKSCVINKMSVSEEILDILAIKHADCIVNDFVPYCYIYNTVSDIIVKKDSENREMQNSVQTAVVQLKSQKEFEQRILMHEEAERKLKKNKEEADLYIKRLERYIPKIEHEVTTR